MWASFMQFYDRWSRHFGTSDLQAAPFVPCTRPLWLPQRASNRLVARWGTEEMGACRHSRQYFFVRYSCRTSAIVGRGHLYFVLSCASCWFGLCTSTSMVYATCQNMSWCFLQSLLNNIHQMCSMPHIITLGGGHLYFVLLSATMQQCQFY